MRRVDVNAETRQYVDEIVGDRHEVIVECAYDTKLGTWKLCNPRYDKRHANFITTVISTMESMVDNVTKQDLREAGAAFYAQSK